MLVDTTPRKSRERVGQGEWEGASKRGENPITNYPRFGRRCVVSFRWIHERARSLHEYVNPYFRIECTRNRKPRERESEREKRFAVRFCHGIDLLARSTYPPPPLLREGVAAFHRKKIATQGVAFSIDFSLFLRDLRFLPVSSGMRKRFLR